MRRPTAFLLGTTVHFTDGVSGKLYALEMTEDPWTLVQVLARAGSVGRRIEWRRLNRQDNGDLAVDATFESLEQTALQAEQDRPEIARVDQGTRIQLSAPEYPAAFDLFVRFAGVVVGPESGVVQSFVGNESRWLTRLARVRVEPSTWRSPEWLWVRLDPGEVGHLPPFLDDGALRQRVTESLDAALGGEALEALDIEVIDGRIQVRGNARSERDRRLLERTITGIEGARGVEIGVLTDPQLEVAVATALAEGGLSRPRPLVVHARLGVVHLLGERATAAAEQARVLARSVAGVREVDGPDETAAPLKGVAAGEPTGDGRNGRGRPAGKADQGETAPQRVSRSEG